VWVTVAYKWYYSAKITHTPTLMYSASKKGYDLNNEGRYNLVLHLACSGSYYDITYDV
jgi:hypothetical protein